MIENGDYLEAYNIYTCAICGQVGGNSNAHHINPLHGSREKDLI